MLRLETTKERGIRKLEGTGEEEGFYFYFLSADDEKTPDREKGIEDDIAKEVAEQFIERCHGSSAHISEALVEMHHVGGIKCNTKHGSHFFHVRRKSGSNISLEIVK